MFSRQLPGCVCRWLPVGARAPQYCSMKQRRRGRPGFWLAVYVACTVLFCIITDSLRQAVVRQSQEGSWAVPGSAKGCALTAACGGRGEVREAVCVYPGLRGPERVCHLFCILRLWWSFTTDLFWAAISQTGECKRRKGWVRGPLAIPATPGSCLQPVPPPTEELSCEGKGPRRGGGWNPSPQECHLGLPSRTVYMKILTVHEYT